MTKKTEMNEALELIGFSSAGRQQSRLFSVLESILKLQTDPPIALEFGEIYEQVVKDDPATKVSKAWVHRVLKKLVDSQLVRLENPEGRRKRYIADANTLMAGFEKEKAHKIKQIEQEMETLRETEELIGGIDCGQLATDFVEGVQGQEQRISSRVIRGKDELHRVLRYNMLDVASKGDTVRATALWLGPFIDESTGERTERFVKAAQRGADVRYLVTTEVFNLEDKIEIRADVDALRNVFQNVLRLKREGIPFDVRLYAGEKTYNQVSFNRDNMVLIIAEDPITATWITRDFNPDLIDNAVASFDKSWDSARSFLELTPEDLAVMGVEPGGPISRLFDGR